MKVQNMTSKSGKSVANQFIICDVSITYKSRTGETIKPPSGAMFQSYSTNIVFRGHDGSIFLDARSWDCSNTTGNYRNQFLGENKKATEAKIKSGEYKLVNLN